MELVRLNCASLTPELLHCPHAERCGGCQLIELPYAEQLREKRTRVARTLASYPELSALSIEETAPAESTSHYRVRAKLVVQGRAVGLYAAATHQVVDLPECRILRPCVASAVEAVRRLLPLPFHLLSLDVREVDSGVLVTWIVAPDADEAVVKRAAEQLRASEPLVLGVAWSQRAVTAARVLGSMPRTLVGEPWAPHRLTAQAPWHAGVPGAFVQAHAGQAGLLYAEIEAEISAQFAAVAGVRVLELYAGAGALALQLAAAGAHVRAVDTFAPALRKLGAAAHAQRMSIETMACSAEEALVNAQAVDAIIVDPPRRGLSPEVRSRIAALRPALLLVISCEPATLARDLAHLRRLGFKARRVLPLDMMPQTDAVEVLAVLEPNLPPPLQVLYEGHQLLAVNKPPFTDVTPARPSERSLLAEVRERVGWQAAMPLQKLHFEASGVCTFARTPSQLAELAESLARGEHEYLALVRGITRRGGNIRRSVQDGKRHSVALTRFRRERVVGTHSLVRAQPEFGRAQHLGPLFSSIGHPVLGDAAAGDPASNRHFSEKHGLDRLFLHCERVALTLAEGRVDITAELAPDLAQVLFNLQQAESAVRAERSEPPRVQS